MANLLLKGKMRGQKVHRSDAGADGAIILDILDLIGRFFKFGMERSNSQVLIGRNRTSLTMLTLSSPFFFFCTPFLHTSPFTPESGLVNFI
jgi:hypothetical protein